MEVHSITFIVTCPMIKFILLGQDSLTITNTGNIGFDSTNGGHFEWHRDVQELTITNYNNGSVRLDVDIILDPYILPQNGTKYLNLTIGYTNIAPIGSCQVYPIGQPNLTPIPFPIVNDPQHWLIPLS